MHRNTSESASTTTHLAHHYHPITNARLLLHLLRGLSAVDGRCGCSFGRVGPRHRDRIERQDCAVTRDAVIGDVMITAMMMQELLVDKMRNRMRKKMMNVCVGRVMTSDRSSQDIWTTETR